MGFFGSEDKDNNNNPELDRNQKLVEAARTLGFEIPDGAEIGESNTISFGLTPDGLEGGQVLADMIHKTWMSARSAGAPVEALEIFGSALLGGFALAISHSLVKPEEQNSLALIGAAMGQTREEQATMAAELCRSAADQLEQFASLDESEEESGGPSLVDKDAAEELMRLFQAESANKEGEEG